MTKVGLLLAGALGCLGCDLATGLDDFQVRDEEEGSERCAEVPRDDFGLEISPTHWKVTGQGQIATEDGRLVVETTPGQSAFIVSAERFDFSGCQAFVELVTPPGLDGYASFLLELGPDDYAGLATGADGTLRVGRGNEPSLTLHTTSTPALPEWWRIRHAEDALVIETSADAQSWMPRRTITPAPELDDVAIMIGGGGHSEAFLSVTSRFDNLNTNPER